MPLISHNNAALVEMCERIQLKEHGHVYLENGADSLSCLYHAGIPGHPPRSEGWLRVAPRAHITRLPHLQRQWICGMTVCLERKGIRNKISVLSSHCVGKWIIDINTEIATQAMGEINEGHTHCLKLSLSLHPM